MDETKASRRRILWLLYQPYKWLIFGPLLVISTCFFVGLGVIIIILFDDRIANRTTGAWWSRFNGFMTPMRVTVIGKENVQKGQSIGQNSVKPLAQAHLRT
jgi:1-acyl-sn-glycerol-3-phosphate acyltransferase